MHTLIAISVIALISLTKPFRWLVIGLLLLSAGICFGIAMILWHFWMNCKNAITSALDRGNLHRDKEAAHRFRVTLGNLPQSPGDPIPLRIPAPMHDKGSRTGPSD